MADESRKSNALVVVDVLNAYDHPDADALVENMAGVVAQVSQLIGRARDEERPVIYVNDNYGLWNSSSAELLEAALQGASSRARRAAAPAAGRELRHRGSPLDLLRDAV